MEADKRGEWNSKSVYLGLDGGIGDAGYVGGNLNVKIEGLYVFGE